ncbi:MAG TPA: hypothetical protein VK533_17130 [Sphingomonas sp.]|uniref:hypothetical protein n=1 Tax=Sphingomonas sp. TaxID=28214 RepID=UPI002B5F2971|nr:hypothetical protein [Sphingomonas sp.]HMI21259.1 hypothetical protein [Sphingomonas sp.]
MILVYLLGIMCLLADALAVRALFRSLKYGVATLRGASIERASASGTFWFYVFVQFAAVVVLTAPLGFGALVAAFPSGCSPSPLINRILVCNNAPNR